MPRLPDTPCCVNKRLETMKREEIKAIQFKMLQYRLERAFAKSPLYRNKYKAAGIMSIKDDIKNCDDFAKKVPFIDEAELVEDEDNHPPFWFETGCPSGQDSPSTGRKNENMFKIAPQLSKDNIVSRIVPKHPPLKDS